MSHQPSHNKFGDSADAEAIDPEPMACTVWINRCSHPSAAPTCCGWSPAQDQAIQHSQPTLPEPNLIAISDPEVSISPWPQVAATFLSHCSLCVCVSASLSHHARIQRLGAPHFLDAAALHQQHITPD